jgi:hypothetical protein
MSQDAIGFVRVFMPRYAARGQYEAMVLHGVAKAIQAGTVRSDQQVAGLRVVEGTRDDLLTVARKGTVVAVLHAHLLVEPSKHGKRQDFWNVLDAIEAKGGVLWELYTGLRTNKREQRDTLTRNAIEALARGRHKTRKSDKRGRPPKEFTPAEWEQASKAWESRRLKYWRDVKAKLPKGMTLRRAWEKFGPRNLETTD